MSQLDLFGEPVKAATPPPPPKPLLALFFHECTAVAHIGFYKVFEQEPGIWAGSYTRFDTQKTSWRRKGYKDADAARLSCDRHFKSNWSKQ